MKSGRRGRRPRGAERSGQRRCKGSRKTVLGKRGGRSVPPECAHGSSEGLHRSPEWQLGRQR
jgi:hypothetical protein